MPAGRKATPVCTEIRDLIAAERKDARPCAAICRGADGYILAFVHHSGGHVKSFPCRVCLPLPVYLFNGVDALNNHALLIAGM
jgi:hypothetical protein